MSQPSEASVYLDGKLRGVTPLTVSNMPVGSHTLILRSSAGTVRKTIRIESDHLTSLMEMIYPGWLAIFSDIPLGSPCPPDVWSGEPETVESGCRRGDTSSS